MNMSRSLLILTADTVFWTHVAVIAFNVFGLVAIPVGAFRSWAFVRAFWWRALHLAALVIVAVQAVMGRACFLTIWQSELLSYAGRATSGSPLIQRWIGEVIYRPLPLRVFTLIYIVVCGYAIVLWILVPPKFSPRPV